MSTKILLAATIDGRAILVYDPVYQPLVRATVISLFTWRRAQPDDVLPAGQRMGWWGDTLAELPNDRIGSRLWLLTRSTIRDTTPAEAIGYAEEALQWMLDDGVATAVDVTAQRQGLSGLSMNVVITRDEGDPRVDIRFANVWSSINAF